MKFVIHLVMLVLIAWPPVAGFAATAMPCHAQSSRTAAMADGVRAVPCDQVGDHSDCSGRTAPMSPACHGGACSLSCTGAAIPAPASLPPLLEFSAVYHSLVDHRMSLFIPEQLQRPPLVA
ncbi:MAG TPA: hypothetical protein VFK51_05705 [Burkholderiales bacterium]|nr:hypothetical protein [Burkholderiales bacterium]